MDQGRLLPQRGDERTLDDYYLNSNDERTLGDYYLNSNDERIFQTHPGKIQESGLVMLVFNGYTLARYRHRILELFRCTLARYRNRIW